MSSSNQKETSFKRHKKTIKDNLQGITNSALKRLARRGGVKRISIYVYNEARIILREYLREMIKISVLYTEHSKKKTISSLDVIHALRKKGKKLYGYGE